MSRSAEENVSFTQEGEKVIFGESIWKNEYCCTDYIPKNLC